jgi:hypothetical protein
MKTKRLIGNCFIKVLSCLLIAAALPAISLASPRDYRDARNDYRESRRDVREAKKDLGNAIKRNDPRAIKRAYRDLREEKKDLRDAKKNLRRENRQLGNRYYSPRHTELRNGGRRYPGTRHYNYPRNHGHYIPAAYQSLWNDSSIKPNRYRNYVKPPRPRHHYGSPFYR